MKRRRDTRRLDASKPARSRPAGCRRTRQWFVGALRRGLGPEAGWVQRHIAHCPRCRKRAAAWRRVELALRIVKARPHRLGLLQKANAEAVRLLSHDLREEAQAREMIGSRLESPFLTRAVRGRHQMTNVAACIAILFLSKSGLFRSLDRLGAGSEAWVRQYYASQVGDDLAGEVFDS